MRCGCQIVIAGYGCQGTVARVLMPGCYHKGAVGMEVKIRVLSGCLYWGVVARVLLPGGAGCYSNIFLSKWHREGVIARILSAG